MSAWCAERKAKGYGPKCKVSQTRSIDSIEDKSDLKKEESSEQFPVQESKNFSTLASDIMENLEESDDISDKINIDLTYNTIEDKNDLKKEKSSEQFPVQENKKPSTLASDIMENQEESNDISDKIKIDLTYNTIEDKNDLKKEESSEQESEKFPVLASDIMEIQE